MLNKDFKEFIQLLNSRNVEYLIVGGYALAAHGHPRYTGDIDLWLDRTDKNISSEKHTIALRCHTSATCYRGRKAQAIECS